MIIFVLQRSILVLWRSALGLAFQHGVLAFLAFLVFWRLPCFSLVRNVLSVEAILGSPGFHCGRDSALSRFPSLALWRRSCAAFWRSWRSAVGFLFIGQLPRRELHSVALRWPDAMCHSALPDVPSRSGLLRRNVLRSDFPGRHETTEHKIY